MELKTASWAAQAETAIKALRDVEGVSIQTEGDEVREIHVLTRAKRPPKQIVRDVQTVLLARFGKSIDYRVVSVAFTRGEAAAPAPVRTQLVRRQALLPSRALQWVRQAVHESQGVHSQPDWHQLQKPW